MFTRFLLSGVPFVLCNLLAADPGAPAGGGGSPAQPAQPKTLAEAISMLGVAREESRQANERATKAEAAQKRLQGQFDALTAIAKSDSQNVIRLRGETAQKDITIKAHEKTVGDQKKDIERLEAVIGAGGLKIEGAVPPANEPEATETAEDWNVKLAAAAAKGNDAQMQVLKDFQAAVKAGKVKPAAKK